MASKKISLKCHYSPALDFICVFRNKYKTASLTVDKTGNEKLWKLGMYR
jgi:hypothetical protein